MLARRGSASVSSQLSTNRGVLCLSRCQGTSEHLSRKEPELLENGTGVFRGLPDVPLPTTTSSFHVFSFSYASLPLQLSICLSQAKHLSVACSSLTALSAAAMLNHNLSAQHERSLASVNVDPASHFMSAACSKS